MGNPIITRTVIVPAGATGVRLDIPGRHVKIVSCTASSVLMGFDGATPERVYADDCYAGPAKGFLGLRFVDDIGPGSTVVLQIAEQPILGGTLGTLAPLAASLAAIQTATAAAAPGTVPTQINPTAVPVSPAAAVQLVTAGGVKQSMIQASIANTDTVYVGFANTVVDTIHFAALTPGGSVPIPHDFNVWARCAAGSGAGNTVNGYIAK